MSRSTSPRPCSSSQSSDPSNQLSNPSLVSTACRVGSRETIRLSDNEFLAKLSHVNDALNDMSTEVYDDEEQEECHFVRIVRIGSLVKNPLTLPGVLVVVHRRSGIYLERLSHEYGENYYLLQENDIMTYIDL